MGGREVMVGLAFLIFKQEKGRLQSTQSGSGRSTRADVQRESERQPELRCSVGNHKRSLWLSLSTVVLDLVRMPVLMIYQR